MVLPISDALATITAALADAKTAAEAERTEVLTALALLVGQVQALKDALAAGGTVSQAQLDTVLASAADLKTSIQGVMVPGDVPPADLP